MNTISSMKVPGLTEDKCVTLIGMAGAGKSTVGRAVAERLGWAYVDTDHLIESTYGARLQDVTDALDKERFLDVEARVIQSLRMQRAVLATGGSVVYRPEAMRYLTSLGPVVFLMCRFLSFWSAFRANRIAGLHCAGADRGRLVP